MGRVLRAMIGVDIIRERWMALLVTFSVAHACGVKGFDYLATYPSWLGILLFALSPLTAVVVGINLLALTKNEADARDRSPASVNATRLSQSR